MKIYFKNKIISIGDGSKVYDQNNKPVLKVKGKIFTFTKKKKIYNMNGELIYKVRRKYWKFMKRSSYIIDSHGNIIMQIRDKTRVLGKGFDVLRCDENIKIAWGGFASGQNKVYWNDRLIGTISRQILSLVDTFVIDLERSSDIPLLVAITTAIDLIYDGD